MKKKFTEDDWISWLKKRLVPSKGVLRSIGDDCAAIKTGSSEVLLVTSDMIVEGTHFLLNKASAREIGHKAMAVSLSDIAAMAGSPRWATVSVGVPPRLSRTFLTGLFYGMTAVLEKYGGVLIGGDTNRSEKLVIDVTLIGQAKNGSYLRRDTAKRGDVLAVTGRLGGSQTAKKHLRFSPRVCEAQFIKKHLTPSAMIDLSDGLALDLRRLCSESKVGALLYTERIPLRKNCTVDNGLYDGEDFELLFSMRPQAASEKQCARFTKKFKIPLTIVGRIQPRNEDIVLENKAGRKKKLSFNKTFQHLKN